MQWHRVFLLGIFLLIGLSAYCSQPEMGTEKIDVVVSVVPLSEFVEKIGGDKVAVSVMVAPGASPHTYEPTPSQLVEVSKADMYVKVGTSIEFELVWLDKILSTNNDMFLVDASAGIEHERMNQRSEHHQSEEYDPHIWLSPKNAKIMVENICKGLISVDASNKEYYTANRGAFFAELENLDQEIKRALSGKTNRRFMVYHPAWGYFARDYNLEQIPVEAGGKEPTARGIQRLIQQAKEHNIKLIFASPQFSSKGAEVIAREIKGRVVLINPLEKEYVANMKKVAQALSEAME